MDGKPRLDGVHSFLVSRGIELPMGSPADPPQAETVHGAQAGVEAGRAGNFGWVVGVDRTGQAEALRRRGADVVVEDLAELLRET